MALTAADDGTLTWWDAKTGQRSGHFLLSRRETAIREVHAAMSDGLPQAVMVLVDGRVLWWRTDADLVALAGIRARTAAFHKDGLLALGDHRSISIVVADGSVAATLELPSGSVRAMAFVGSLQHPVLWIISADGLVRRWEVGYGAKAPPVAVCPAPLLLAGSDDGEAVVVDVSGELTFPGRAGPAPTLLPRTRDILGAHLSREWLVLVGGQALPWLEAYDLAEGSGARWPLDDLPVAVAGCGHDRDLLLATRQGIAAIRLTRTSGG
jgi:hypothetical protein